MARLASFAARSCDAKALSASLTAANLSREAKFSCGFQFMFQGAGLSNGAERGVFLKAQESRQADLECASREQ